MANPEKELEEFLAPLPLYVQKSLWYDPSKSEADVKKELFDEQHRKWPFSDSELQQFRECPLSDSELQQLWATSGGDSLKQELAKLLILLRGWQPSPPVKELRPQFERILQRIPGKWKLYRKNAKAWRKRVDVQFTPKGAPGAPRKVELARKAALLLEKQTGKRKNYVSVANELNKTLPPNEQTTPGAIRRLMKRHSQPDKI